MRAHFGQQVKAAREAKGYTQEALGRLIGIEGNSLARIERGANPIRWANLEKLIDVLGQPPSYFFSDKAPETKAPDVTREKLLVSLFQKSLKLDDDSLALVLRTVEIRLEGLGDDSLGDVENDQ